MILMNSRIIWFGLFLIVGFFAQNSHGSLWKAEDALIVEVDDDPNSEDEESTTVSINSDSGDNCLTSDGLSGQCIKSRDCYPYLYLGGDLENIYAHGLARLIQNTTESCDLEGTTISPNESTKPGDRLVCCATLARINRLSLPTWPIQEQKIEEKAPEILDSRGADTRSGCGITDYVLVNKIVGGRPAHVGEFPFIVAIIYNNQHICGGALVDSSTVLTAAHCVNDFKSASLLKRLSLRIGDHDIYSGSDVRHEERKVKRLVFHSKFNIKQLQYDIAMFHLDRPVTFTKRIQPVCLHSGSPAYDGGEMNADVSGWGRIHDKGPLSQKLLTARIRLWTNSQCSSKYRGTLAPTITNAMVCAGTTSSDSCQGDSGGPLTLNVNGREHLVGIVSWGIACGQYPGVYTRVDKYLTWINKYRPKK